MATTLTSRLHLAKQGTGDNPGDWGSTVNDGFDDADDRLLQVTAGVPDALTAAYIGQRHLNTVTDLWSHATDTAVPSTWILDLDTIETDITFPDPPTTLPLDYDHGHLHARLEWVSDTQVKLAPVMPDGNIYYDNNGARIEWDGDFVFDITTDLEGVQAIAVSTPFYLYMDYSTGPAEDPVRLEPDPIISLTPPNEIGTEPAGYHPTEANWRCVGSIWVDSGEDIARFNTIDGGRIRLDPSVDGMDSDHYMSLNAAATATMRTWSVNVPLTATAVSVFLQMHTNGSADGYCCFAQDGDAFSLAAHLMPISMILYPKADLILQNDTNRAAASTWECPIKNRAVPAFLYGHADSTPKMLEGVILGWTDLWAPKY